MSEENGRRGEPSESDELSRRLVEITCRQEAARDSSRLLDETLGECEAIYGRSEFESEFGLREIRNRSLEDYQSLENELETLVGTPVDYQTITLHSEGGETERHRSTAVMFTPL